MEIPFINITYVRHGFSCSNLASSLRDFTKTKTEYTEDPALTLHGIDKTLKIRSEFKHALREKKLYPNVICSSELLRAIETALLLFKDEIVLHKKSVNVIPYARETGNHISNLVIDRDIQLGILESTPAFDEFDFTSEKPAVLWRLDHNTNVSNYEMFINWVALNFKLRQGLNILVVSHGNFIADHVLKTSRVLDNNDCVNVRYSILTVNGKPQLVQKDYEWIWRSDSETDSQFVRRITCDKCSEF